MSLRNTNLGLASFRAAVLGAVVAATIGCGGEQPVQGKQASAATLKTLAETLDVKYRIVTNRTDDKCDKNQTDGLCFQAELELNSSINFDDKDWAIYFSNMAPVQNDASDDFDIIHLNGDLHKIVPTASFTGFKQKQSYAITFRSGFWHLSQTDRMPNYYLAKNSEQSGEAFVIKSTQPVIDSDTGLEQLPYSVPLTLEDHHFKRKPDDQTQPATANWLYQENAPFYQKLDVQNQILPTPRQVKFAESKSRVDLSNGVLLNSSDFELKEFVAAFDRLLVLGVDRSPKGTPITVSKNTNLAGEAYRLTIGDDGINIEASESTGAFYAIHSLAGLLQPGVNNQTVPHLTIEDEPRFEFRGMHVEVSRNFKSKGFILDVLEQMSWYKLNKLHFHVADDEGWRIEIPSLPELTEVGAYRCHDLTEQTCLLPQLGSGPDKNSEVNGYYTFADYLEILRFAKERHIQVIPSMDMPGHSRAAIKAMAARYNKLTALGKKAAAKQYLLHDVEDSTEYQSIQFYNDNTINACMESSYDFIAKVFDELKIMHEMAGNPLTRYHIGADETAGAWINSSACEELLKNNVLGIESPEDIAAHFVERVSRILAERQIEVAGWSDGMGHTNTQRMPKLVQTNAWGPLMWGGHKSAHEQANRGWQVVISSPDVLYFDFPYEADANERGYYWAARRINSRKVFNFMPENLPVHAEFYKNRQEQPYVSDDTKQYDEKGKLTHQPLKPGVKFHGMQGQLWSETVRTDHQASYMIFPRLYALAERAWHQAEWEVPYNYDGAKYDSNTGVFNAQKRSAQKHDWIRFANVVSQKVLPSADKVGLFYRLPTPGATIENGILAMNSLYPGLAMEYRESGKSWKRYESATHVKGDVEVRTVTPDGKRKGRILTLTVN